MVRPGRSTAVLLALFVAVGLAGCIGTTPERMPTPSTAQTPSTLPSPSQTAPPEPTYNPTGTARDNLAFFDSVNQTLLSAKPAAHGRTIIDNLVAAGFDKKAMQVTPDATPTRNATDSIEFSVRLGDDCLIGQSSGGKYTSLIGPALDTGACLVGKTRAINW